MGSCLPRGNNEKENNAFSRVVLVLILVAIIIAASIFAFYFATTTLNAGKNNNTVLLEALSVNSSSSNITASINLVRNTSSLVRMGLYINGTFVGAYNYTGNTSGGTQCCIRMMNAWNNGTYSMWFMATPYSMPMMNQMNLGGGSGYGCCMAGRSYLITIMCTFANGEEYNATSIVHLNQQGMGSMMR